MYKKQNNTLFFWICGILKNIDLAVHYRKRLRNFLCKKVSKLTYINKNTLPLPTLTMIFKFHAT